MHKAKSTMIKCKDNLISNKQNPWFFDILIFWLLCRTSTKVSVRLTKIRGCQVSWQYFYFLFCANAAILKKEERRPYNQTLLFFNFLDVYSVICLVRFRALKLTQLESFKALKGDVYARDREAFFASIFLVFNVECWFFYIVGEMGASFTC